MQREAQNKDKAFTYNRAKVVFYGFHNLTGNLMYDDSIKTHNIHSGERAKIFTLTNGNKVIATLHEVSISDTEYYTNSDWPIIPCDATVAILCIDPLRLNPIDILDRYVKNIPADFNGHVIVCSYTSSYAPCYMGTPEFTKKQRENYSLRKSNLKSTENNIAAYCKKRELTFEHNILNLDQLIESTIKELHNNKNQYPNLFEEIYSIQFHFRNVTPDKLKDAINYANNSYSNNAGFSPIIPNCISNTDLQNKLPINVDNAKANISTCFKLLDILQGPGDTDTNSFKYQLISELFNLTADGNDEKANEAVAKVINLLKSSKQIYQWEQIKPFLIWNHPQDKIPTEIRNDIIDKYISLNAKM